MANKNSKKQHSNKKQTAPVATQPGIIKSIMDILTEAKAKRKMLTARQVHERLVKQFPDRKPGGMLVTVRAQLSRLPDEKKFAIKKGKDGRQTTYAAA